MITIIQKALYWSFIFVVAMLVFVNFLYTGPIGKNANAPMAVGKVLAGTADRPYIYRVLLPIVANLLAPIVPKQAALHLGAESENILGGKFFSKMLGGRIYPQQVILILAMIYLSLVGFSITIWYLIKVLGYSPIVKYITSAFLLAGCTIFTTGFGFMYDFPQLFLFSASLLFMYLQKWHWFLFFFVCGTLNKETTILLYPIFAIYFFRNLSWHKFVALSACQLGFYGLIRAIIIFIFRGNSGQVVEWHLYTNIATVNEFLNKTPLLLVCVVLMLTIIAVAIVYKWRYKPRFLRTVLLVLPIFLLLYITSGYLIEIRTLLEVYPIVGILMLPPPFNQE